jgi:protein CpxP
MKGFKTLSIALVFVMFFCSASLAGRFRDGQHGFGMGHGFMGFKILEELNLSDAQKAGISEIILKYRDERRQHIDKLIEARKNLSDTVLAETFNEADVRQAFGEAAALQEEAAVIRAKIFSEIRPLLTPEQLALISQRKAELFEKIKDRMAFGQSVFDAWLESYSE